MVQCGSRIPKEHLKLQKNTGVYQFHLMYHIASLASKNNLRICVFGDYINSFIPILSTFPCAVTFVMNPISKKDIENSFCERVRKVSHQNATVRFCSYDKLDGVFDIYITTYGARHSRAIQYISNNHIEGTTVFVDDWKTVHSKYGSLRGRMQKEFVNTWPAEDTKRCYPETWWNHLNVIWL